MSSDESTATQFSTVSSQAGNVNRKTKAPPPDQWEINLIGNFLLMLYHRLEITPQNDFLFKKSDMRKEFRQFITPELLKRLQGVSGTDNIGALLHRCNFLLNTPRKSNVYKINNDAVFSFRQRKVCEQDKRRINDDEDLQAFTGPEDILNNLVENKKVTSMQVVYEVDESSPVQELQYEGTKMQERRPNYFPTNMSCLICQEDFSTMLAYEEHIQIHNDENDFEYVKQLSRFDSPIFNVNYQLCKNSHHFCFNLKTDTEDIIIERIIIVQSRSMFYVHNMRVPYPMPENNCEKFYVDSHLFTMFVEQPIVIIFHLAGNKNIRIIEEHHFMRVAEFPKVNFAIKPYQLPSRKTFQPLFKLPDYFPPLEIRDALTDDFVYQKIINTSNEFREYVRNEKVLQPTTIGQTLTTLLHIEDMDTLKEYLGLLQHNVTLRGFGYNYNMKLRPRQRIHIENVLSVFDDVIITTRKDIKHDSDILLKLMLQNKDDINPCDTYLGSIEDVNSGRVSFRCYKRLDLKRTYTVIFRPSRTLLRYQYRAMELLPVVIPHLSKFLFPARLLPKEPSTISLVLYNRSIANNPEQYQAVRNIAEGPRNDATYIIFGPPGTGKTTTLVEAILQVLKRDDTKILVTASSNAACDEVALRLCRTLSQLDMKRAIVRIYAQTSEARIENFDDLLLEHSNLYTNVHFYPDIEVLHEYRIVVCTMSVVAKLATGKFGRNSNGGTLYTHLFIDEVAAATEVEALMPITSVLTPKSCLIIAGDHKQLGPIVKSKRAEEFNLGVSLMDRLLKRECYSVNTDTGEYDRTIQTRLRMNFRSHPAIVQLYSGMYYNHALEAKADIDDVSLVKHWHLAPNKDFPIIFHYVNGKSFSDSQSYSLHNSEEINVVMHYVKDLMYFGINGKPIKQTDIGVISPYKKQYLRIREELNLRRWYEIETGSVENFQGKEKAIIIVSFVRSNTSTLGFLDSQRRLNVTLSRAKSLLILIGNARTLSLNPDYAYIIKECQRHQTFIAELDRRVPISAVYCNNSETPVIQDSNSSTKTTTSKNEGNTKNKPLISKEKVSSESTLDLLNDTLKDLKLQNHNENKKSKTTKITKHKRRQRRNGRPKKDNKNKNVVGDDGEEDDDSDDDNNNEASAAESDCKEDNDKDSDDNSDDKSDDDDDNKPSTSKSGVSKTKLSRSMKKKPKKTGKVNAKNDLDALFDDLPSVPKTNITSPTTTKITASGGKEKQQQQQQQQMPTFTPPQNHVYNQPNPFNNFPGIQQQMPRPTIPQNYQFQQTGFMAMPQGPQYPPTSYFHGGPIAQQYPQYPQPPQPFMQPNFMPLYGQNQQMVQQKPGLVPPLLPQQTGTNNTTAFNQQSAKQGDDNNKKTENKNAQRRGGANLPPKFQKKNKAENQKDDSNGNGDEKNNQNSPKNKNEGKSHLGQNMKKKNLQQSTPKISKAALKATVTQTKDNSNVEIKENKPTNNAPNRKKGATTSSPVVTDQTANGSSNLAQPRQEPSNKKSKQPQPPIPSNKISFTENQGAASAKNVGNGSTNPPQQSSTKKSKQPQPPIAPNKNNQEAATTSTNVKQTMIFNFPMDSSNPNKNDQQVSMTKPAHNKNPPSKQQPTSFNTNPFLDDIFKQIMDNDNIIKSNTNTFTSTINSPQGNEMGNKPKPVANIRPIATPTSSQATAGMNNPPSSTGATKKTAKVLGAAFNEATLTDRCVGTTTITTTSMANSSSSGTNAAGNVSAYTRGAGNHLTTRTTNNTTMSGGGGATNSITNRPSTSNANSTTTGMVGVSRYTTDELNRSAASVNIYDNVGNISSARPATRSNTVNSSAPQQEPLRQQPPPNPYNQPNRPVRNLSYDGDNKKKNADDKCIIA
ncbi:uncharacterized protein [Musca autumnalis]|uniref:uncharacterized protein n=1 Tax=Musca autumnalis TaxID=221902 RepID=UPI003CEB475E